MSAFPDTPAFSAPYSFIPVTGDGVTFPLTCYCVSVHVIEHIPEAEYPGSGDRRPAPQQGSPELVPGPARVRIGVRFQAGAHASRQRLHLVRTAAAFDFTSITVHAHFRNQIRGNNISKQNQIPTRQPTGKTLLQTLDIHIYIYSERERCCIWLLRFGRATTHV